MTHKRKLRNLNEFNKPFVKPKKKNPNPNPSKGIQLVINGKRSMKVCSCGCKQFDRNSDCCIECGLLT